VIAELQLRKRVRSAVRALGYLALTTPLAMVSVVVLVVVLPLSVVALVTGSWLGTLRRTVMLGRAVMQRDRLLSNRLLETRLPPLPLPAPTPRSGNRWRRAAKLLGDVALRRNVLLLVAHPLIKIMLLVVGLVPVALMLTVAVLGLFGVAGIGSVEYVGPVPLGVPAGLALWALTVPVAVLAVAALDGLPWLGEPFARRLLSPHWHSGVSVRELLAESLGDRSVSIVYWLPERESFVDEAGHPAQLPGPEDGRTWTLVERDGRPVAAIIHDAALDASRELVQAAAAASSMAIDNERLKADLRARVEELRVSRLRIVEAADEARRRIERDLHDGAQQQLVALALELRLLRNRAAGHPELQADIDRLSERLSTALEELRELARGIHPSVLTDRGLGPAIDALVDRAPLPVDVEVEVQERLPPAIESAAYFTVAEGLTNVVKYAKVGSARVAVRREDGEIHVLVEDDGVGGVDIEAGSGLRGLQDRLAAVDGRMHIESGPEGTVLEARIPLEGGA